MQVEQALIARRGAMAAAAWFNVRADTEAYRRLAAAVNDWKAYQAPHLDEDHNGAQDARHETQAAQTLGPRLDNLDTALRERLRTLHGMDPEAESRACRVTSLAAAWFDAPAIDEEEIYRRFRDAVGEWNSYCAPRLDEPDEELLDELGASTPPRPIAADLAHWHAATQGRGGNAQLGHRVT